jgi:subtilisin family serine protease
MAQQRTERLLIRFADVITAADVEAVKAAGAKINKRFQVVPGMAVSAGARAITALENNPRIVLIEADSKVFALDAELDNSWGVKHIGAAIVHESGNKGAGVSVAVVDTGIDYNHPDLAANYAGGKGFVGGDDPMDDHSHGTHCAGTLGAVDDDIGVIGVAPEVDLYAVKVLNSSGQGYWSTIILGVEWCIANGMQVTSNSYGGTGYSALVEEVFQKAWDAGIVSIAAAGNNGNCDGTGTNTIFPANFESVISVAATDKDNSRACFSSTGKTVELAAPGASVYSTVLNGEYGYKSGTSMATPHTAGLVALMMAAGNTNNDIIREALQLSAIDLGDPGPDNLFGHGLIDAVGAVNPGPINRPPDVLISSPEDGARFILGDNTDFAGTALDEEDGDITSGLVWVSSIDGQIGTGGSFSYVLSLGTHTIAASVMDSGNKSGSSTITVTIEEPPPPPKPISIEWIAYSGFGGRKDDGERNIRYLASKHFKIYIRAIDEDGEGVPGAGINYRITALSGDIREETIVTKNDGIGFGRWNNAPAGCFETEILSVVADGYLWDGATPGNGYCSKEFLNLLRQLGFFLGSTKAFCR